jgi:hypothetical protein
MSHISSSTTSCASTERLSRLGIEDDPWAVKNLERLVVDARVRPRRLEGPSWACRLEGDHVKQVSDEKSLIDRILCCLSVPDDARAVDRGVVRMNAVDLDETKLLIGISLADLCPGQPLRDQRQGSRYKCHPFTFDVRRGSQVLARTMATFLVERRASSSLQD